MQNKIKKAKLYVSSIVPYVQIFTFFHEQIQKAETICS